MRGGAGVVAAFSPLDTTPSSLMLLLFGRWELVAASAIRLVARRLFSAGLGGLVSRGALLTADIILHC